MTVYAILAIVVALSGLVAWASRSGANSVKAKQAKAETAARDLADEIQNDIGAMPPEEARKELSKWSKP